MAPDEIHFLILLYLIYLSDCCIASRSSTLMLFSRFGGLKFCVKTTDTAPVFARGFWMLRPLLPPLGFSRCLELDRLAMGSTGFCSISAIGQPVQAGEGGKQIAYDDVESIIVKDCELIVNGEAWFKSRGLTHVKEDIEAIIAASDRAEAVRERIQTRFRLGAAAREEIAETQKRTSWLNLFCSMYALALLFYMPLTLFRFSPHRLLWGLGVPILLLHVICAVLFLIAHARVAKAERGRRWETFFKMFLCPPMMIRACDVVTDAGAGGGDAMAVLMAAAEEKVWRPVAKKTWRALIPHQNAKFPIEVAEAIAEHAAVYRDVFASALREAGVAPESLDVDFATIPRGQRVCPRCASVYRGEIETCEDCGGVRLLAGTKEND